MARHLIFILVVAMATTAMADDATQPEGPTEEQVKEVVFEVSKQMVAEVNAAVKTINEVFGAPTCEETVATKRSVTVQRRFDWSDLTRPVIVGKRSWADVATGASVVAAFGKRSDKKKRFDWGSLAAGVGRRSTEKRSIEKRGWGDVAAGAAIVGALGKRSDEEKRYNRRDIAEASSKKRSVHTRSWGDVAKGAALVAAFGKRSNEQKRYNRRDVAAASTKKRSVDTRSWEDVAKGAALVAAFGKRSNEQQNALDKRAVPSWLGRRAENAAPAEDPRDEIQFEADVAKLTQAVKVLNEVLLVAEASLES